MGEFIDFGEPLDKRWREDLLYIFKAAENFGATVVNFEENNGKATDISIYDAPWEEHELIKKGVYAIRMCRRFACKQIKHLTWVSQRALEIRELRKACYYAALRAVAAKRRL